MRLLAAHERRRKNITHAARLVALPRDLVKWPLLMMRVEGERLQLPMLYYFDDIVARTGGISWA